MVIMSMIMGMCNTSNQCYAAQQNNKQTVDFFSFQTPFIDGLYIIFNEATDYGLLKTTK